MFALRHRGTVIAEGLKIVGSVTAEGLVEVNGQVEGDLHCTFLIVSPKACIKGGVRAKKVVVNGKVEGPINGEEVVLKSHAVVVGDIHARSLTVENGALFEGRSMRVIESNLAPQAESGTKPRRETGREASDEAIGRVASLPHTNARV